MQDFPYVIQEGSGRMIFVTAMTIGIAVGLQPSLARIVAVAALIGLAYGAAACLSGTAPLLPLLSAIAGYNAGLIGCFVAAVARQRPRNV